MSNTLDSKRCELAVEGMHCASCEVLVEKKIKKLSGVKYVDANISKGNVVIDYEGSDLDIKEVNRLFADNGYTFSNEKKSNTKSIAKLFSFSNGQLIINKEKLKKYSGGLLIALIIFLGLYYVENSKLSSYASITSTSSLGSFFIFGLIAGLSSCAALVGGLLLSLSRQWSELYIENDSFLNRAKPFVMFNAGRLIAFAILGGILGYVGSKAGISTSANPIVTGIIISLVSIYMLLLGLHMLGINWVEKIRIPKFFGSKIVDEERFKGKLMPFIVGALTFFLPCGFTLNVQAVALTSGSISTSALIMFVFALGTLPLLALISFTSVQLAQKPKLNAMFNLVAGVLVVIFALYNINAQLNVLGLPSLTDIKLSIQKDSSSKYTSKIFDTYQVLETTATSTGYSPAYATIKAGLPLKWDIEERGASGCTNAIISNSLLGDRQVSLLPGDNSVDIASLEPGLYKYSCWMGMYSGVIEVIP